MRSSIDPEWRVNWGAGRERCAGSGLVPLPLRAAEVVSDAVVFKVKMAATKPDQG
jgi:hypothetical protein